MAIVDVITEFADALIEALSPPTLAAPGGELARLCVSPSTVGFDDAVIGQTMAQLNRVVNLAGTAMSGLTDAAGRAGLPARKRVKTSTDLLKQLGITPAAAHRYARTGHAAHTMPGVMVHARTGGVPIEQLDAIGKGVAFVGRRVPLDEDRRADLARRLSCQVTPADVSQRARELALEWAPEIDETDPDAVPIAENPDLNEMTLVTGDDGRTTGTLDLDALTGEELNQALDPLCKPIPQPDGSRDPRTAKQRRSDALAQVIRTYLNSKERPTVSGGVLPHVTMIVPTQCGDSSAAGRSSQVASLGFTGPVSPATVGLVLCEAAMRRVILDQNSAPLDVGREHRLVTAGLRRALEARDRGCAFPGCGRPISWTDAHHCVPWSEGGDTAIDNCVLLCRMHHTLIHQTGWEVFIGHDRHPWFRPPLDQANPDRHREPIRSNARRTMTAAPTAAA
ncbi:HNH endonuclease signature motif containing protein [Gordonia hydrophobica]|uniref:DUF222 domain-containing protein n=1 Tax=Gordonia hydrophobica TaxID=40516 RepID=A0ABZ2U3W1_9ACTN|nr:HNH endonuclease signature motif containing protein [Gordonia hydrophobica]MBM7367969.1 hypothetical protein [Gordonia hydrophobica]